MEDVRPFALNGIYRILINGRNFVFKKDLNGVSTNQRLFYAESLGNCINCLFAFSFFV